MFPWQVFGLTGLNLLAGLPGGEPSVGSAFVPDYRCGAVPEFHRIPIFIFPCGENHRNGNHYILGLNRWQAYLLWISGIRSSLKRNRALAVGCSHSGMEKICRPQPFLQRDVPGGWVERMVRGPALSAGTFLRTDCFLGVLFLSDSAH